MNIYTGTSGWSYDHWVDTFYPHGLKPEQYLRYYSSVYKAVEIDSTFYRIPDERTIWNWDKSTDENFKFCPKMFRKVTHELKLSETGEVIETFMKKVRLLGKKLGVILVQMPPTLKYKNSKLIHEFIESLPQNIKFAFEFRDDSWFNDEIYALLRDYGMGLSWADTPFAKKHYELTNNFLYLRLVGDRAITEGNLGKTSIDRSKQIEAWASKVEEVSGKIESGFIFANNHYEGFAPATINVFMKKLGIFETYPINKGHQGDYQSKLF